MIRFLHLADTHLGARHPGRGPGDPFVLNLRRALAPARDGRVHEVVLSGSDGERLPDVELRTTVHANLDLGRDPELEPVNLVDPEKKPLRR